MKKLFFLFLCVLAAGTTALNAQTCNAAFSWLPNPNGNNLLNVDFTNSSTAPASTGTNTYVNESSINFGDGTGQYISGSTVSHNYAAPGTYDVTLIVKSYDSISMNLYCSDTLIQSVTVAYSPCASSFAAQSNGNGSYTFTANTPAGTSGMAYSWDFGDGTSGTGNPITHVYSSIGVYAVTLTSTGGGCTYTNTANVTSSFYCNAATADFNSVATGSYVDFTNTSSGNQGNNDVTSSADWDFGDGNNSSTSNTNITHYYAAIGTYTVSLVNYWHDSVTNQIVCTKTVSHTVMIDSVSPPPPPPPPVNIISGMITWDSSNNAQSGDSIKVWLIVHDTTANTLTAVDSQFVDVAYALYSFNDKPTGDYLVKANYLNQTAGAPGYLPTYHLASVYWNSATNISHTGGTSNGKDIHLQNGTVTSGPGFIGGNISAGAGRGIGTGVEGILVFLRNNSSQLITSVVTNAAGDFSFSNLPAGTYNVYPEAINYATTAYNTINVTSAQAHVSGIDFVQTDDEIKPKHTTGIIKVSEKDGLKIYPNPAKNSFTIENQNNLYNQVKIVNAVGQSVKEVSLKSGINKVDISDINAGIYYILIHSNDSIRSMKFVKQ